MTYEERRCDLFSVNSSYYFAYCISVDLRAWFDKQ